MEKRTGKRILVTFIFLALAGVLAFGLLNLIKPKATCEDGIKNQLEEGIDCGGPCPACEEEINIDEIEIKNIEWVDTATGNLDIVVKIQNPNSSLGASTLRYKLNFFDVSGNSFYETRWLQDFILPQQEKYLLAQEINTPKTPAKIEVEFGDIDWKKFTAQEQNPRLEIILAEFSNSFRQDPSGFYRVTGTLVNESPVDCEEIKIKVVLRDNQGELLATHSQSMNTVYSKEKRDFNIPFSSDYNMNRVTKVEIKPETNIFDSDNTVNFYGITEEGN